LKLKFIQEWLLNQKSYTGMATKSKKLYRNAYAFENILYFVGVRAGARGNYTGMATKSLIYPLLEWLKNP
jgi:hypothetical protein